MRKIKLICLPYAGGSMQVYKKWTKYLDDAIELIPLELAGRGRRLLEPPYESMNEAVDDVYMEVRPMIENSNYAIFGHSMGSVIAYELVHKLRDEGLHNPEHVFFSGRNSPHVRKNEPHIHNAPLEVFIDKLLKMGGTPKKLLENVDFINAFIPMLRADFKIIETYSLQNNSKIECDISALSGRMDQNTEDKDMKKWENCTSGKCNLYKFDGGHFFINDKTEDVVRVINNVLTSYALNNMVIEHK